MDKKRETKAEEFKAKEKKDAAEGGKGHIDEGAESIFGNDKEELDIVF